MTTPGISIVEIVIAVWVLIGSVLIILSLYPGEDNDETH